MRFGKWSATPGRAGSLILPCGCSLRVWIPAKFTARWSCSPRSSCRTFGDRDRYVWATPCPRHARLCVCARIRPRLAGEVFRQAQGLVEIHRPEREGRKEGVEAEVAVSPCFLQRAVHRGGVKRRRRNLKALEITAHLRCRRP